LRLDCLQPGKALFGEVSWPDVASSIDQYPSMGLPIAGRKCSLGRAKPGGQINLGLVNVCLKRT